MKVLVRMTIFGNWHPRDLNPAILDSSTSYTRLGTRAIATQPVHYPHSLLALVSTHNRHTTPDLRSSICWSSAQTGNHNLGSCRSYSLCVSYPSNLNPNQACSWHAYSILILYSLIPNLLLFVTRLLAISEVLVLFSGFHFIDAFSNLDVVLSL